MKKLQGKIEVSFVADNYEVQAYVEPVDGGVYLAVEFSTERPVRFGLHEHSVKYCVRRTSVNRCLDVCRRDTGTRYPHEDLHTKLWDAISAQ